MHSRQKHRNRLHAGWRCLLYGIVNCYATKADIYDEVQNITCLGENYDLDLPMLGNINPNELTMQHLRHACLGRASDRKRQCLVPDTS